MKIVIIFFFVFFNFYFLVYYFGDFWKKQPTRDGNDHSAREQVFFLSWPFHGAAHALRQAR